MKHFRYRVYDPQFKAFYFADELRLFRRNVAKLANQWDIEGQLIAVDKTSHSYANGHGPIEFTSLSKDAGIDEFIGQVDMDNKPIYSGDIVNRRAKIGKKTEWAKANVEWCDEYSAFCLVAKPYKSYINQRVLDIRVVGNIHQ